jgi:ATP-binding cassette subfamily C (CFTR/MRP) protein 1
VTQIFAPVLTFAVFSVRARDNGNTTLDTARVFTSLSLFALLSEPISSLVMSLATFLGAVGSFTRIQKFMQSDERVDTRKLDESAYTLRAAADAITVRQADFKWDPAKPSVLRGITLSIPSRKFTMVVGPVGCGKSTLLNGILGEIPALVGSVHLGSSSIAYCAQDPWHMNGTARQAIVGSTQFDQDWYNRVVRACALRPDFRQLPMGDLSSIGSGGIALSGGQGHRIVRFSCLFGQPSLTHLTH